MKALRVFQESDPIPVVYHEDYGLREYLKTVDYEGQDRCSDCYAMRLKYTAAYARQKGFDAFTSTMLFSVYQNHEQLKLLSENISKECGVGFVYRDYRHLSECSHEIAKKRCCIGKAIAAVFSVSTNGIKIPFVKYTKAAVLAQKIMKPPLSR